MKKRAVYCVIWLDMEDSNPAKYSFFTSPTAMWNEFGVERLGVTQRAFITAISRAKKEDEETIIYTPPKNPHVRIVKGYLTGKEKD